MPIQPAGATKVRGTIEVCEEFESGLRDLRGFSRIILLYVFDRSEGYDLVVTPFLDKTPRGLFSTRAPRRPVPIGISTVKLLGIEGNILDVEEIDVCDGTPLLDIKPYVPYFDAYPEEKAGWFPGTGDGADLVLSDSRFIDR